MANDDDDDWNFGKGTTKKSSAVSINGDEEEVAAGIESVYINVTSGIPAKVQDMEGLKQESVL